MQLRTNTLLVITYCIIGLIVTVLVFYLGAQHQRTERLLAELNAIELEEAQQQKSSANETRRSMRPALVRLQSLLEKRTKMIREQQSELHEQVNNRQKLQQRYDSLNDAYQKLSNDHELLINEVDFYLSASGLADADDAVANAETASQEAGGDSEQAVLPEQEQTGEETLSETELEVFQLQQQIAEMNSNSQREALISSFASHAMIEMGAAALPALTDVLQDKDPDARSWAAWVLGQIGSDAAVAVPELERLLDDADQRVAEAAEAAIGKIEQP